MHDRFAKGLGTSSENLERLLLYNIKFIQLNEQNGEVTRLIFQIYILHVTAMPLIRALIKVITIIMLSVIFFLYTCISYTTIMAYCTDIRVISLFHVYTMPRHGAS